MQPRAVVFDYGHTLLEFAIAEERLLQAYEEVRRFLESEAVEQVPEAAALVHEVSRRIGQEVQESYEQRDLEELDVVQLFEAAFHRLGFRIERETAHQIAQMEHRAMAARLEVPPENLNVLRDLRAMGLKIGLVSNAHFLPTMMREDIERLGIAQFVDDAVFSAEIGVRKPHEAIFRKVLDAVAVEPEAAVFVGDRLRDDIAGAKALGMRGVLTQQYRQEAVGTYPVTPDLVIQRLPELTPWVASLMGNRRTISS